MTANHLAAETSPYLLQHASNPVDWFPWGEEALRKAKREGKPIFLSIGYSACHWCHVMAHESFNDERIAAILNERFVSIKVDREERPDLDRIYMAAVQALTGNGGWPMSVFLTPDGAPFYGGTYYPPTARYGLPSFEQVLLAISDAWQYRREQILNAGRDILSVIQANTASQAPAREPLSAEILVEAESALTGSYDSNYGGWGDGPKFPQPMALAFLLRRYYATRNPAMLRVVAHTLEAMARGGMYDQLGGGFHRYAVDAQWLTPHFEKMLYDNAQLARVYLHAWQMTGESFFRTIAEETLDYLAREMTDAAGGFYSSQDADSDGHEGAFFTWAFGEAQAVLGSSFERFARSYPITVEGNFEGRNILTLSGSFEQRETLADAREKMRQARDLRTRPGRDDKVLTSWNGLALAALAEAARALDRSDYLALAERNATFSLAELRATNGRLYHTWKSGQARLNGYLEDYAYLIDGLLELYATTFEPRWFVAARELADTMIAHFASPDGFYDTSDDHESLIVRPSELQDNATPSGSAMASSVLLRLASLAQEPAYTTYAERNLMRVASLAGRYPQAFGQWLIALDALLMPPRQVAIVGDLASVEARALVQVCRDAYDPHLILAAGPQGSSEIVPLLKEYVEIGGRATAYVCSHAVCLAPVNEPSALQSLLESTRRA